jgi:hypothetical protein
MSTNEKGALEITKDGLGSIEALVKDARGNAIFAANDRKRISIGAGYLRLAGRKCAALSELIEAVAEQESRRADKAKKRLAEIDRDIEKYLDFVDLDNERFAKESGAIRMTMSGEDLQKLMRGEQPPELIAKIEAMKAEQESA